MSPVPARPCLPWGDHSRRGHSRRGHSRRDTNRAPHRPSGSHLRARPRSPAAAQPQHAPHGRRHHRGTPPSHWRAGPGPGRGRACAVLYRLSLRLEFAAGSGSRSDSGASAFLKCSPIGRVVGYTWSCIHNGHQVSRRPPGAASCLGRTVLKAGL